MNRFLRSALFPVVVITLIVWLGTQTLMNNHSKSKRETLSSLYDTVQNNSGSADLLIGADATHPTVAGHIAAGRAMAQGELSTIGY